MMLSTTHWLPLSKPILTPKQPLSRIRFQESREMVSARHMADQGRPIRRMTSHIAATCRSPRLKVSSSK